MAYERERSCVKCGKIETVRKDNASTQCKSCASSAAGAITGAKRKAEAVRAPCHNCAQPVKSARAKFCSVSCKSAYAREGRICKTCGSEFEILKSALKTNASGNFCSRSCYEVFLCRTDRMTGRGSQWKKIRDAVAKAFPFCGVCGTTKNIQVHHIVPFRLTHDNSPENLIPLCTKHHKWVEMMFVETEAHGADIETQGMIWKNMLRSRQQITASIVRRINADL